ncbi:MAG: Hsp20/alpha crystallin family protein [Syntrophobacterales bacterium]|nr:MAG: Hsp20/alpha crystallin family protein [Syntrophobacterales bacterium]
MNRMIQLIPSRSSMFPTRDIFNRFFSDGTVSSLLTEGGNWIPAFDISESETEYLVSAELPGIDAKDLEVTLNEGVLNIKGEKRQESEKKEDNYIRVERSYGSFDRSFRIPEGVQVSKIDATYKDGILKLTIPKSKEMKAKKIKISVN